jgi:hypothetical protein
MLGRYTTGPQIDGRIITTCLPIVKSFAQPSHWSYEPTPASFRPHSFARSLAAADFISPWLPCSFVRFLVLGPGCPLGVLVLGSWPSVLGSGCPLGVLLLGSGCPLGVLLLPFCSFVPLFFCSFVLLFPCSFVPLFFCFFVLHSSQRSSTPSSATTCTACAGSMITP